MDEKVWSSTPVIFAPSAVHVHVCASVAAGAGRGAEGDSQTGKVEETAWTERSCRTTLLRSPWASAAPSSDVNFFCWKMDLSASAEGAQVPFCFWRPVSKSIL